MRQLSALLSSLLLMSLAHAQNKPEPIRLCVSTLQNISGPSSTRHRSALIKAFERNNKGKNVSKGKAARIETVLLESNSETDPAVRENNCQFILHTNVVEIINVGTYDMGNARPHSIGVGSAPGDPRTTVSYRIMRAGELKEWASGDVTEHDQLPDEMLISHLMDRTADRVVSELREPH